MSKKPETLQRFLTGTTTATLDFFTAPVDGSKAYNFVDAPPEGVPFQNYGDEPQEITVKDIRGRESEFTLDEHGFQVYLANPETRASKADFSTEDSIAKTYYPEVERFILGKLPGSHRILIFDNTLRRDHPGSHRRPISRAHVDQTPESSRERVRLHLPDEAEELLKGRVRIIIVWRPLNGRVEKSPLAVADSRSVPDSTLIGVDIRYPHRTGENAGMLANPDVDWWYWSGMDNDERLVLQIYDSKSLSRVPHASFTDERWGKNAKPRESIEVRMLVFG